MIPPDVREYAGMIEGEFAQLQSLRVSAPEGLRAQIDEFIERNKANLDPEKIKLLDRDEHTKGLWLSWAQNTLATAQVLKDAVYRGFQQLA